jgi:hypothetical protein
MLDKCPGLCYYNTRKRKENKKKKEVKKMTYTITYMKSNSNYRLFTAKVKAETKEEAKKIFEEAHEDTAIMYVD